MPKIYFKGQTGTSMDVMDTDLDYWKSQGWSSSVAAPAAPTAPVAKPVVTAPVAKPAPVTPAASAAPTVPVVPTSPVAAQPRQPVQAAAAPVAPVAPVASTTPAATSQQYGGMDSGTISKFQQAFGRTPNSTDIANWKYNAAVVNQQLDAAIAKKAPVAPTAPIAPVVPKTPQELGNPYMEGSEEYDTWNSLYGTDTGNITTLPIDPGKDTTNGGLTPDGETPTGEVPPEQDFTSQVNSILEKYGISPVDSTKSPVNQALDAYKQVYEELGLGGIKSEFDHVQSEYAALQEKKTEEVATVNANPWLSEGQRQRKVKEIENKYESKTSNLLGQMNQYQSMFESGQREAEFVMGQVSDIQSSQDQRTNALVNAAIEQVQQQMTTAAPTADMQEYLAAVDQGFKGNFVDYKNAIAGRTAGTGQMSAIASQAATDPRILAGLTPSARTEILSELASAGYDVSDAIELYGSLTEDQSLRIEKLAQQYDSNQIVKRYQILGESRQFVNGLSSGEMTSTDDQGLLYAFAKAMDPDSVVREGEYATVQKYAQSWAEKFGFDVKRFFSNTPFLTDTARKNMMSTIDTRYQAVKDSYDNYRSQVGDGIDRISGNKGTWDKYLIDYTIPESKSSSASAPISQLAKTLSSELNTDEKEVQEAMNSGMTATQIREYYSKKDKGGATSLRVTLPGGTVKEGGTASWRNNNPLNIKYGSFASNYGAIKGSSATDGGSFAAFPSEADGLKAARDLLKGNSYANLTLEAAMRRWSGNGYGADVAPASIRGKTTGQMTDQEIEMLIKAMSNREGYKSGRILA